MPAGKKAGSNIFVIIGLAALFFCMLIFTIARILHISNVKSEIKQEELTYRQNQARLSQLTELSKRKDEFQVSLSVLNNLVPDQANETQIINQIQEISSPVDFIKIQFNDIVVNNNMNVISMDLSFSGDYNGLIKLIGNIASGQRLIRIDEINITKSEESSRIAADLKVRAFYR